jgi:hypothetical protein
MLKKNRLLLISLLLFATEGFGQYELSGKVVRKGSAEVLMGVTVVNQRKKQYASSDTTGSYSIVASPRDTIIFSSAGYLPDTVFIAADMRLDDYIVALTPNIAALPSVDILEMEQYRQDSLSRRAEYAWLLNAKHPVKLMNEKRAADAPGLNFSPLGYFSRSEKQKRRLKKRLSKEEEDYYVDYKFSITRVSLLTGLKGDSLKMFLTRYRPSYAFCRTANNQDMFLYINDKLILFKEGRL